jgi:hypothetical protein
VISKLLVLAGAAAAILSVFLTWVTVTGLAVTLDLDLVSAQVGAGNRTVAGIDTVLWPAIVVLGGLAGLLGLLGVGRRLLVALGLVLAVAGGLLLVYMSNVLELETRDGARLERAAAQSLLESSVGPGTPLLLAGGVLIVLGALARGRRARS